MWRSRRRGLAVVLPTLVLLGACAPGGSAGEPGGAGIETVTAGELTLVLNADAGGARMEAQLVGTLALDDQGCVVVEEGFGRSLVAFPAGTDLDEGVPAVVPTGEDPVALGDEVDLGGGFVPVDRLDGADALPCDPVDELFLAAS